VQGKITPLFQQYTIIVLYASYSSAVYLNTGL